MKTPYQHRSMCANFTLQASNIQISLMDCTTTRCLATSLVSALLLRMLQTFLVLVSSTVRRSNSRRIAHDSAHHRHQQSHPYREEKVQPHHDVLRRDGIAVYSRLVGAHPLGVHATTALLSQLSNIPQSFLPAKSDDIPSLRVCKGMEHPEKNKSRKT